MTEGEKMVKRRRVTLACDRCRVKKAKCDGISPCTSCERSQSICSFSRSTRAKHYACSQANVELLIAQQSRMVVALQELYERLRDGRGWDGPALVKTADGTYSVNEIIHGLGQSIDHRIEDLNFEDVSVMEGDEIAEQDGSNHTVTTGSSTFSTDSTPAEVDACLTIDAWPDDWLFAPFDLPPPPVENASITELQWSNFMAYNLMLKGNRTR